LFNNNNNNDNQGESSVNIDVHPSLCEERLSSHCETIFRAEQMVDRRVVTDAYHSDRLDVVGHTLYS